MNHKYINIANLKLFFFPSTRSSVVFFFFSPLCYNPTWIPNHHPPQMSLALAWPIIRLQRYKIKKEVINPKGQTLITWGHPLHECVDNGIISNRGQVSSPSLNTKSTWFIFSPSTCQDLLHTLSSSSRVTELSLSLCVYSPVQLFDWISF